MTTRLFFLSISVICFAFISCQSPENPPQNNNEKKENLAQMGGTAAMIRYLKEAKNKIDPMAVTYFANSRRAEVMRQRMENSTTPNDRYNYQMFYGYELMNAGKNEDAIMTLESLFGQLKQINLQQPEVIYQIKRFLSVAYMRLGEQNNCIGRNNEESCIMPIEGKGLYTITEATKRAIGLYEEMLKEKPDDQETIWLLNFAYMTLGEYPDKVPAVFRIPKSAFQSDYEIPKFTNISTKSGVNTLGLSGGACVDDFNNDGFLDIFASSWGFDDQIHFYLNNGDSTGTGDPYTNYTKEAGLTGLTGGLNLNHTDYNNDGLLDVLVLRGAWFGSAGQVPNSLLRNNGDGTFSDVTIEAGLLSFNPTQTATWADFNLDGWLDLFIGNESLGQFSAANELYLNNGNGTFTNRTRETGMDNIRAYTKGVTSGDVNNDCWPDLYLSFLDSENKLILNKGLGPDGLPQFVDITADAGVREPVISFPTWFWDFDNDGWQDIFVACFSFDKSMPAATLAALNFRDGKAVGGHPRIYRNNGQKESGVTFTEISQKIGLTEAMMAMGSNYGDIDNDGFEDFYLGTGEPNFTSIVPNKMLRNNKGLSFQDVTTAGGFGHVQKGHGVAFADMDNDGDQDIFCVLGGAFEGDVFEDAFFLNPMGNEKSWVTLKLEGTTANRAAIGARLKLIAINAAGKERVIHRTVSTGGSFGSNSLQQEIGLDDAVKIKSIEVRWPNREQTVEVFENVEVRRFVKIKEGRREVEYLERKPIEFLH